MKFDMQTYTMIQKFKNHDFYYEYLDNTDQWKRGYLKHCDLINEVRKMPMNKIPDLLKYVPENMREKFIVEINLCGGG